MKVLKLTLGLMLLSNVYALNHVEKCLIIAKSYCPGIKDVTKRGKIVFTLTNGEKVLCSDRKNYDLNDRDEYLSQVNNVDASDILLQPYPFTTEFTSPLGEEISGSNRGVPIRDFNYSPGRFRNDKLLIATYGSSAAKVRSTAVRVNFLGKRFLFNTKNGAAKALQRVSNELTKRGLHKNFWKHRDLTGGIHYRKISGTNRISAHAYGMTIDLSLKKPKRGKAEYWKWGAKCRLDRNCRNRGLFISQLSEAMLDVVIPRRLDTLELPNESFDLEVVSIFEKHGFIWGGKWFHYDTVHFEYRPEFMGGNNSCEHIARKIRRRL